MEINFIRIFNDRWWKKIKQKQTQLETLGHGVYKNLEQLVF